MCDWNDVHDHAEDARQLGWNVEEVVYEDTGHCAHYSSDAGRYEKTVAGLWSGESAAGVQGVTKERPSSKL